MESNTSRFYEEIYDYVSTLEIIDTHEHLPSHERYRERDTDILKEYLTHYFNRDLISAGLSKPQLEFVLDQTKPLKERFLAVKPYWEVARFTGYGQSIRHTLKALYGVDDLNEGNILEVEEQFKQTFNGGQYKRVLKDMSNIKISVLDNDLDCDREYFRSVYHIDWLIFPTNGYNLDEIERLTGIRCVSFSRYLQGVALALDRAIDKGAVAFKLAIAYKRSLSFARATYKEAEASFNEMLHHTHYIERFDNPMIPTVAFQNYLMHYICDYLNQKGGMVMQIHTGLQEGNGNILSNSDPSLLNNIFYEYQNLDFDVFHIGYPYQNKLGALAKMLPNVNIDMCWAHIISPTASITALAEWLEAVPYNKISAFGGDYCMIDTVYGHQLMARQNVSRSLAIKCSEGLFSTDESKVIAKALFYTNPKRILKLDGNI